MKCFHFLIQVVSHWKNMHMHLLKLRDWGGKLVKNKTKYLFLPWDFFQQCWGKKHPRVLSYLRTLRIDVKSFPFPVVAVSPPCSTATAADQEPLESQEWHQPACAGAPATVAMSKRAYTKLIQYNYTNKYNICIYRELSSIWGALWSVMKGSVCQTGPCGTRAEETAVRPV